MSVGRADNSAQCRSIEQCSHPGEMLKCWLISIQIHSTNNNIMCADLLSSAGILAKCSNDELNSFLFMSCLWAEQTTRHNAVLLSSAVILAKCSKVAAQCDCPTRRFILFFFPAQQKKRCPALLAHRVRRYLHFIAY